MRWQPSVPCIGAAVLVALASPVRAADPAVTACGQAYLKVESAFVRRALRLSRLLCESPGSVDQAAIGLVRTANRQIAAFNGQYTAAECDPDVSLPVPLKKVPDVRRLLEYQFRSIPLDRFCNGTLDPLPLCGNGQEDPGEVCDGGDLGDLTCESLGQGSGTLACSPDCQGLVFGGCSGPPFCGNGIKDAGEACDTAGSSATCDYDCTAPACGDHVVNEHTQIPEQCDDGNLEDRDNCNRDCAVPWCGNGRVDGPREECDEGVNNGPTARCYLHCQSAVCGDGILNPTLGEECDDGNLQNGDGCSAQCRHEGP